MTVVKMTRTAPEVPGAPTNIDVAESDIDILKKRGWYVVESAGAKTEKEPETAKSTKTKNKIKE